MINNLDELKTIDILEQIKDLIKQTDHVVFEDIDKKYLTIFTECQVVDEDCNGDGIYDDVLYICGSDEGYLTHYEGLIHPQDIKLKIERDQCPDIILKIGMEYYEDGHYSNLEYRKDALRLLREKS
jgi:hypothetical protein